MGRRAWLVLGWGIVILTVVDGAYLAVLSSYLGNEPIQSPAKGTQQQDHLYGPVVIVLKALTLWLLDLVERNDKVIMALSGLAVALFTGTLWRATTGLQTLAEKQGQDTERALVIAERTSSATRRQAEVTVRGVSPFLVACTYKMSLHPEILNPGQTYEPAVGISFENVGKTPAMLRRMGAQLLLIERDALPAIPPALEDIPAVDRGDVVSPGERGGARLWRYNGSIDRDDLSSLKMTEGPFLRFYAVGYVIYEDVFGGRTTHRFCLKLRQNGFEAMRGDAEYNRAEYDANPKGQPRGRAEDKD